MAQTRAVSRAYRNIIGFLIKLAGYEATPYEEMDGVPGANQTAPADAPQRNAAQDVAAFEKESKAVSSDDKPSMEQYNFLKKMLLSSVFSEQERQRYVENWNGNTKAQASAKIESAKALLESRKKNLAAAEAGKPKEEVHVEKAPTKLDKPAEGSTIPPITINQKTQILLLLNNSCITKEEKERMVAKINTLDTERAEQAISKLKKAIKERAAVAPAEDVLPQ